MGKILTIEEAAVVTKKINAASKKIVLAGGCFDILHVGHIRFLSCAKDAGDVLIVLLESDDTIRETKGENRPINTQKDRAEILSALTFVDYIILLPRFRSNSEYDALLSILKPAIIATTKGDSGRFHKERQAQLFGSKVLDVIDNQLDYGTSKIVRKTQV